METEVASLYEQLNEKKQLNEVLRLELETFKHAASRARSASHGMLCTVRLGFNLCFKCKLEGAQIVHISARRLPSSIKLVKIWRKC